MSIRRLPRSSFSDDTLPLLMSRRSVLSDTGVIATASLMVIRAIVNLFLSELLTLSTFASLDKFHNGVLKPRQVSDLRNCWIFTSYLRNAAKCCEMLRNAAKISAGCFKA